MELLCGGCSQEQGLALDERIKLAKSRLPNTIYTCPVCEREHAYQGEGGKVESIEPEPNEEAQVQMQKEKKKSEKIDDSDQLSLF